MDTANMDSQLYMYDLPQSGVVTKDNKADLFSSLLFNEDSLTVISDLDPNFESSHNIQDLISKEGVLFPDLLQSGSTLDGAPSDIVEGVVALNDNEQPEPMRVVYDCDLTNTVTENREAETSEVIVIRPEDLAALGVTLSGDLKAEPEPVVQGASASLIQEIELDQDQSISSSDLEAFQFSDFSASSPGPSGSHKLKAPSSRSRRTRNLDKHSEEYRERREKNNIAVRKSRDKAKVKQQQTHGKVQILTDENERLQKKVDLLTKELNVLKGLFTNVGVTIPDRLAALLK